ncbi:MAG: CoF synthetase [Flavobacteriia bacterium]|nr:MAG: CoF synthetase [Flavobacteriia bacterium]
MGILHKLRKSAFWFVDTLNGGKIRKHFDEIKWVLENPESDMSKKIKSQNLYNVLEHSATTVPYYSNISHDSLSLHDFPIIDKQTVRDNFELFRSQTYTNAYAHEVTTSGSTGKPFKILHDKNKRKRNTADTCFFAEKAGYELGSRLFYLRLWDKQYQKKKMLAKIQNIAAYSVDDLTEENLDMMVSEMENYGSSVNIIAYSSALDTVCKYIEEHLGRPLNCKVDSIISIAEGLSPDLKGRTRKYLGEDPVSRYSNSENGIFAQQKTNSDTGNFEINWASYHIELLDFNEDKPVKLGDKGRIVITDFFNYSMPLIRYDTGDVGVMEKDSVTGSLVFTKIEGRKMDMFTNTKGEYVSSHIIHHILQYSGIDQFQFIEDEKGEYTIKLKVTPSYDHKDEKNILEQYKGYFGQNAIVNVEYVDNISLLPSGKRKLVINNYKPSENKLNEKPNVPSKCSDALI